MPAAYQIGPMQDISGSGRHLVHIQMNHVSVQKINIGRQLFVGIGGGVGFAQQQMDQVGDMLVLVRHLEGEVAHEAFRVAHDAAGQVIQEISLSAVGHSGHDDQASYVGGVENAVGQRSVAHAVAMVVFAVQHVYHFLPALFHRDDIGGLAGTGIVYDVTHHFGAVELHHIAYVLASSGQDGEKAACPEIIGKMFYQYAPGQVGVTADHDVLYLVQPGDEGLEAFCQVACRSRGYADDMAVSCFHQCQRVFSSFYDNEPGDDFLFHQQRVDAVYVIGGAWRGGRILTPEFAVRQGLSLFGLWRLDGAA